MVFKQENRRLAVIGLAILCVIFLVSIVIMSAGRQAEHVKRANLEQDISKLRAENEKLTQNNEALQEVLSDVKARLEEGKNLVQSLKGALAQEQLISQSLRSELEKVIKEKQELEEGKRKRR